MRSKRTFQFLGLVVAILLMSVGYAAIQNVELSVSGQAVATPDQGNFKVGFTGEPTHEGTGQVALKITGERSATMQVSGLKAVGDTMTAKFTIANTSDDITAYLSTNVTQENSKYFEVTASLSKDEIAPDPNGNSSVILSITVTLIKTPVTESQTDTLTVNVIASPYKLVSFKIACGDDIRTYTGISGMTLEEWSNTEYVEDGWFYDPGCGCLCTDVIPEPSGNGYLYTWQCSNSEVISAGTTIEAWPSNS